LLTFLFPENATCINIFFIITDYDVRFIVRDVSLGWNLFIFIIWVLYLNVLLLLILVHAHTSLQYVVLPLIHSICQSVVEHTLLSCLVMYCSIANIGHADNVIYCDWQSLHLLPVSICRLIFLLLDVLSVIPVLVLLLFHF
jgi:hypothetical protein